MDALSVALRKAAALQARGRHAEAIQQCQTILEEFPEQPDALHLRAILQAQARNYQEALQWFERAARAAPGRADILGNQAKALLELGELEHALALCQKALSLDASRFEVHKVLGSVYMVQRQWQEAETAFRRSLQLKPDFAPAWNNLGNVLRRQDRGQEAMEAYRKALQLQPDNPDVLSNMGKVCRALGHMAEASRCFNRALQLRPDPRLAALAAEVSPLWLEMLRGRTLDLRRYAEQDAPWLRACFGNAGFMQQYHRFLPATAQGDGLGKRLRQLETIHPAQTRSMDWVIVTHGGERLGMANLVDIDFTHRRAELLFGIPEPEHQAKGPSLEALLLVLDFVFNRAGLNKLTNLIYADNRRAQEHAEQIGFVREGVLRQQVYDRQSGAMLDVCCNGMTRDDFTGNARIARLSRRKLGRDITRGNN